MRKILRRLELVVDEWRYLDEEPACGSLIVPYAALRDEAQVWRTRRDIDRLGVRIGVADKLEELAPELGGLELVAFDFPNLGDGRGYSVARLLRERYRFAGEVRAVGKVKRDQLFFMARAGFDAFELSEGEDFAGALESLQRFTVAYTPGAYHPTVRAQRYFAQRSGSSTSVNS